GDLKGPAPRLRIDGPPRLGSGKTETGGRAPMGKKRATRRGKNGDQASAGIGKGGPGSVDDQSRSIRPAVGGQPKPSLLPPLSVRFSTGSFGPIFGFSVDEQSPLVSIRNNFAAVHESRSDAVDGSSAGTRVPSSWGRRLRLPRFGRA